MRMFKRKMEDETMKEVMEDMLHRHRWTRNIPPPSTPKRVDPNEPPFALPEFPGM